MRGAVQAAGSVLAGLLALGLGICQGQSGSRDEANSALQAGQADKALILLQALPPAESNSAQSHNLRCRVLFTLERFDEAVNECQEAVALDPQNSDEHMWLGRALGEKADKASFVTAYNLAKKARAEFELAVQLNPRNAEALADLGEFYNSAPGVVGGGTDKAENIAAQLDHVDPVRAHELRGFIAENARDFGTAEREFRQALAITHQPAFQWVRLASFYRRTKQWKQMDSAVQNAFAAAQRDRHASVALFNGASVLIKANQDPALAIRMLQAYLASANQTEEAPVFVARVWLAKLLNDAGDKAGAERERQAALAMASSYRPAQELKF